MDEEEIEQIYGWQKVKHVHRPPLTEVLKKNNESYTPEVALECLRQMRELITHAEPYKKKENS